ncbi:MAG: Ser-Thr-rich GPI-anchored membrane family protein [Candidatus Hodarchaeota archaeon]
MRKEKKCFLLVTLVISIFLFLGKVELHVKSSSSDHNSLDGTSVKSNSHPEICSKGIKQVKSQFISILSPSSNDVWYKGGTYNITIETDVLVVDVYLTRPGEPDWSIGTWYVELVGKIYSWSITRGEVPATNYRIKIIDSSDQNVYAYSDYFTIEAPAITVTSPNSSSVWTRGQEYTIKWDWIGGSAIQEVGIYLYKEETYYIGLVAGYPNNGSYKWEIWDWGGWFSPGTYKFRIQAQKPLAINDIEGWSDYFTIQDPKITVTNPSSSSTWAVGSTYAIEWTSTGSITDVKIELYSGSTLVATIDSSTNNDGHKSWTVPNSISPGTAYYIKITDTNNSSIYDDSDYFTIEETRSITVTNPSSSSTWLVGSTNSIEWTSTGIISHVKIELYSGSTLVATIDSSTNNDGHKSWTVPNSISPGTAYYIKITDTSNNNIYDDSDYFTIEEIKSITVTKPSSSSTWAIGSAYAIEWTSTGSITNVKIELYDNSDIVIATIDSSTDNDGHKSWTVPNSISPGTCYIKITDANDSSIYDNSDYFTISVTATSSVPADTTSNTTLVQPTPGFNLSILLFSCAVLVLMAWRWKYKK